MIVYDDYERESERLLQRASEAGIARFALGAAVIAEPGLLIVQRAPEEEFHPGYFELPGGRMEKGETLLIALMRELVEETHLVPRSIQRHLDTFDFLIDDGSVVRQFNFLVEPKSVDVMLNPIENSSYFWISDASELDDVKMTPDMKKSVLLALKEM